MAPAVAAVAALLLLAGTVLAVPTAEECRHRAAGQQFAMADMSSDPAFRSCALPFASPACCSALSDVFGVGRPLGGCQCHEELFDDMRQVVARAELGPARLLGAAEVVTRQRMAACGLPLPGTAACRAAAATQEPAAFEAGGLGSRWVAGPAAPSGTAGWGLVLGAGGQVVAKAVVAPVELAGEEAADVIDVVSPAQPHLTLLDESGLLLAPDSFNNLTLAVEEPPQPSQIAPPRGPLSVREQLEVIQHDAARSERGREANEAQRLRNIEARSQAVVDAIPQLVRAANGLYGLFGEESDDDDD